MTVVPPAPPVVPVAKPSAVLDQVRPDEIALKAHCLLELAVQVSWMTAAPDEVDAPWSETQSPLLTLMIWYVPEPEATNFHCWFVLFPQVH